MATYLGGALPQNFQNMDIVITTLLITTLTGFATRLLERFMSTMNPEKLCTLAWTWYCNRHAKPPLKEYSIVIAITRQSPGFMQGLLRYMEAVEGVTQLFTEDCSGRIYELDQKEALRMTWEQHDIWAIKQEVCTTAADEKMPKTHKTLRIKLFSYESLQVLKDFVNHCTRTEQERNNRKNAYIVFWDPKEHERHSQPFITNRTFDNMFFDNKEWFLDKLNRFLASQAKYDAQGRPWTLGVLLTGPPGTGKTSLIKALSKHTKRDVCVLYLPAFKTSTELQMAFENNREGSIMVLEDIDCMGSLVQKRETIGMSERMAAIGAEDALSLSCMLNLMDGLLENPGRIIIMTTNHPEMLDPALLRPGRIDIQLHMSLCSSRMIQQIMQRYYELSEEQVAKLPEFPAGHWTPAQVNQIIQLHGEDMATAERALLEVK